jgi:hypothetical protein
MHAVNHTNRGINDGGFPPLPALDALPSDSEGWTWNAYILQGCFCTAQFGGVMGMELVDCILGG